MEKGKIHHFNLPSTGTRPELAGVAVPDVLVTHCDVDKRQGYKMLWKREKRKRKRSPRNGEKEIGLGLATKLKNILLFADFRCVSEQNIFFSGQFY
tara:strand:+ start:245 stop:532 length:288 start_codon:yes stop_codon:yes gene_type:complete